MHDAACCIRAGGRPREALSRPDSDFSDRWFDLGAFAQEKSRMCFAGSIRDIILVKSFDLISVIVGLFAVMLIYNIATGGFRLEDQWTADRTFRASVEYSRDVCGRIRGSTCRWMSSSASSLWQDRDTPIRVTYWDCLSALLDHITLDWQQQVRQLQTRQRPQAESAQQVRLQLSSVLSYVS